MKKCNQFIRITHFGILDHSCKRSLGGIGVILDEIPEEPIIWQCVESLIGRLLLKF